MAADALQVLDSAEVASAHVLGISLGGMIAQEMALARPERVRGLVLGCTTHGGRDAHAIPEVFVHLCMSWAAEADPNASALLDDFIGCMLPAEVAATPAGATLVAHFKEAFQHTRRSSTGLLGQVAAMGRFNSTKRLEALGRHRTMVIAGERDAVVPPANSASLHARIPAAELELRQDAGHFFWAHKPAEVSSLLAAFLERCDEDGPPEDR